MHVPTCAWTAQWLRLGRLAEALRRAGAGLSLALGILSWLGFLIAISLAAPAAAATRTSGTLTTPTARAAGPTTAVTTTARILSAPGFGPWVWPLAPQPIVRHGFDLPARRWLPGHRGVDLAGSAGQDVRSAGRGVVVFAGTVANKPVVAVQHGRLRTTYEPVVADVRVGQPVAAGTVIGQLVRTGSHCLPRACLHWGLRRGADYLDPLALVRRGPPRLLPVWGISSAAEAGGRAPRRSTGSAAAVLVPTSTPGPPTTAAVLEPEAAVPGSGPVPLVAAVAGAGTVLAVGLAAVRRRRTG